MFMHQYFPYDVTLIDCLLMFHILARFFSSLFVLVVFVDLILHVLFFSVLKNSKTHNNSKISKKFDRLCCVYHM